MPRVGELVQTRKGYVVTAPTSCANGHQLGPGQVSVAHEPCGSGDGGHTTWKCLACGDVTAHPPAGSACRIVNGPAGVRNF